MKSSTPDTVVSAWSTYKRLLGYVRPIWYGMALALLGNVVYSAIDASFIKSIQTLIDDGLINQDPDVIKWAPIVVLLAFILRGFASFLSSYCMAWVGTQVVQKIRDQMFEKLVHLPVNYFDHNSSGEILSRIIYNTSQVSGAATQAITTVVREGAFVIFLLASMFMLNWKMSLLFLIVGPLVFGVVQYFSKRFRHISHRIQDSMGALAKVAEGSIEAQREIKIFNGQQYEIRQFKKATKVNLQQQMKMVATRSMSDPIIQTLTATALSATIYLATQEAIKGQITAGSFTAMLGLMMAILRPIKQLSSVSPTIQQGVAAAQNIFQILDLEPEPNSGQHQTPRVQGRIDIQNLKFDYPNSQKTVLNGINLNIKAGESVALVGRSGSGKTTLTGLLARFYPDYQGQILIDDVDIQQYELGNLRSHFALVSQHVVLFNDTIANNLLYARADASRDDLIQAARMANALEFIEELPLGFDSLIGDNGVLLSGGQRQRLAIARALLKDAPILILDEATSALDTESERLIQSALDRLMQNRTTIVIAHRLSTIENVDRILVLHQGQIVEQGSHQQLLQQQGAYARLHKMQFHAATEQESE